MAAPIDEQNIDREKQGLSSKDNESDNNYIRKIERIDYISFFRQYILNNKPVILPQSHTAGWRSRREWVGNDGEINFDLLESLFGILKLIQTLLYEFDTDLAH